MHESYQFKNSGKPDNLQLPWTTYHTKVSLRPFAILPSSCPDKPLELKHSFNVLLFGNTVAVVNEKHLVHIFIVSIVMKISPLQKLFKRFNAQEVLLTCETV